MEAFFLVGAIQALFFAIIVFNKQHKEIADLILGFWLISLFATLLIPFIAVKTGIFAQVNLIIADVGLFASQPVWFYMYTYFVTEKSKSFKPLVLLNFIPSVLVVFFFLPLKEFHYQQFTELYNNLRSTPKITLYAGLPLFTLIYSYILFSLKRINTHRKSLKHEFSYEYSIDLQWLHNLALSLVGIIALNVILVGVYYFDKSENALIYDYIGAVSYVGFVFALGYFGYQQGTIFSNVKVIEEAAKPVQKSYNQGRAAVAVSNEEDLNLTAKLAAHIKEQKPWLNPTLSLYDLAKQLDISSHELTSLLNEVLKTNFYDYINHHRVEEVKKCLISENNQFTILAIALECGFNSKASFNRIFKQKTGKTPSEFLSSNRDSKAAN